MRAPLGRTFIDLLREQSERYRDAIAVISGSDRVSYSDLLARAGRVSAALHRRGLRRGERVGILMSNRLEWLEICFGASALGATVVPFSTWSTRHELEFLLEDSGIRYLFALASFGDRDYAADLAALTSGAPGPGGSARFPKLEEIVILGARTASFTAYEDFLESEAIDLDLPPGEGASAADDGLVLYTSGSSAKPKAVRLKLFGIIENGFNIGERQGLRPGDRVLLSPPLFWSYGGANALPAAFTHGATLVLQEKFDAGELIDLIERHGCTAIYTLPGMTSAIIRHPQFRRERVASLRTGLTIGPPQDFLEAAQGLGAAELCNVYGATETYGNCCVTWHHWPLERRAACQGPPLPGNELRFVDVETGEPVERGKPGLTEVRGYVMAGYSGASAELQAQVFTEDGFYRTGDIGYLDEEGAFVFVGRNAEMIKKAGINVSPAEVEEILLQHPGVAQAGVTGVPDRQRGEIAVAFVVPARGANIAVEDLLDHCRSVAFKYKVPDRIELCKALRLTATGKLQRRALKETATRLVEQPE